MPNAFARIMLLAALAAPLPALAQETPAPKPDRSTAAEPDYLDDRSDAKALIRSLYNAVNRKEYVRAYGYFRDEPDRPSFESFAKGYADTAKVELKLGTETSEGAAGSLYYSVPVAIRSVDTGGKAAVFSGCYELRLVQPGVQAEPPFRPLGIVKGRLEPSAKSFDDTAGRCPPDGL
ncbi:hypothetical protein [Aureimonas leprariae]|uniref:DUF1176 domain-containing protein n=1 Tax=Plantimonas leprariae TaxID=2615207 RepID=A0A7V7PLW3_9HYPH|nr:hypothetical protein [Aureimonas leprariae]KAB0677596.1 hypothetical protein F6X38_18160 [Aureimonas leprariae]